MKDGTFKLTDAHIKLLKHANIGWQNCEFGAPAIDCKRPYGNSDVITDIADILGLTLPEDVPDGVREMLTGLHRELQVALQVVLSSGSFQPGTYIQKSPYDHRTWVLSK